MPNDLIDWDKVAAEHVFPNFRGMVSHLYYHHGLRLTELAQIMQNTHSEVSLPALRAKFVLEDFPLREIDEERR